jgi:4-aminobutyrate aminotransferase/(S)-3-amino-2-methylpropionate transaminase
MLNNQDLTWIAANRPALGVLPPSGWAKSLKRITERITPESMQEEGCDLTTMSCGSTANENAFKAVFIKFMDEKRKGAPPTQEELNSAMVNSAPGCPPLSILSFSGAFHGRTFGCLATTRSKPIHKLDVPHFDWPMAPFPELFFPLDKFEEQNAAEEDRCLEEVRKLLQYSQNGVMSTTIAGMIIEPIQAEGGDNYASDSYFRRLRSMAKDFGVRFIVDEVQTGGGTTGKMWAHEHWNLEDKPDVVTFAKKTQIAGYFSTKEMRPKEGFRIFNTWMGDPSKLMMLDTILDEYEANSLIENAGITGSYLRDGLRSISKKHQGMIGRVRGRGTFVALSVNNTELRDKVIWTLRQAGVQAGGCGAFSIRLRPSMIFTPTHAQEFLKIFENVMDNIADAGELGNVSTWNTNDPRNIVNVVTGEQGKFHKIVPSNPEMYMDAHLEDEEESVKR